MGVIRLTGRLICRTPDEAGAVAAALPDHIRQTRAEPGCLSFAVEATDDPLIWQVTERFRDRAAFDAHQARVAASDWGTRTIGIMRDYTIADEEGAA